MKTENGAKTVYTYNALNQLVKENDAVYKYDDAGNLISTTSADKSATYTYNAENKLIRATVQEGNNVSVEEYEYDYAGNRISKTTGTETVTYLNDNSVLTNVIAEFDADGNMLCYYTIGADLISQERNGKTSFYLYDGHGSVRGLVDESGKITDTYNYDAFGNLLDKTGTTVNNYLYCGEQLDSTTGLYYLRARYMNPTTGTFITQDTYAGTIFDPTSLHKYLYANANPVMYTDPSGYMGILDHQSAMAGSTEIDKAAAMRSEFAMKFFKNFMKKIGVGAIGGLLAVVDQRIAGVTDPEQLAIAFRNGFLAGFAFTFASGKVAMALGALGTIGGFAGAVKSFHDGEFWQGIYRLTLSTIGGACWYKQYGAKITRLFKNSPSKNPNEFTFKESGRNIDIRRWNSDENGAWGPQKGKGQGLGRKAPDQVEAGIRYLEGQYIRDGGRVEPWKAYYDEYGRLIARTDYNAPDPSANIPSTHFHLPKWTRGGKIGEEIHYNGEYTP